MRSQSKDEALFSASCTENKCSEYDYSNYQAHIHHYTHVDGMDKLQFDESLESLNSVIREYTELEQQMAAPPEPVPRLQIVS